MKFWRWIINWLRGNAGKENSEGNGLHRSPEQLPPLVRMVLEQLEVTQEVELSCDELFELLDQYTEIVHRGEDAARILPLVQHHLEMCPDCREEFEALLAMLEARPN